MKGKEIDNTFLRVEPITGRKISEYCFDGVHKNGVDSLCRAVACKCVCHDAKEKKPRAKHVEPPPPPIRAEV